MFSVTLIAKCCYLQLSECKQLLEKAEIGSGGSAEKKWVQKKSGVSVDL